MDKKMMICTSAQINICSCADICPLAQPHDDCENTFHYKMNQADNSFCGSCSEYVEPSPKDKCPECGHEISDHKSTGCWKYDFEKGYCGCGKPFNSEPQTESMPLKAIIAGSYCTDYEDRKCKGCAMKRGACESIIEEICLGVEGWLPAHDQQVRKDFVERIIVYLQDCSTYGRLGLEEFHKAHLRAMAGER